MARGAAALMAGAVLAGSLFAATPAFASPVSTASFSQCPVNRFCTWSSLDGTGVFATFTAGVSTLPRAVDNNIESVWNRTSAPWCLYDSPNFRDPLVVVAPSEQGNLPPSARNRVSSLRPC